MANSKRKCKHCKDYVLASEGTKTNAGFFCSIGHAIEFANQKVEMDRKRAAAKAFKAEQKEQKQAKLELKRNNIEWQHNLTQKAFNRMRVLEELLWFQDRGMEPTCISCGNPIGGDVWACGHYKTVGARGDIRYDRRNTYLQHNVRCNMHLSGDIKGTGNTHGYEKGLVARFGDLEAVAIMQYCEPVKVKYWTREELEDMRKTFNAEIRRLEKLVA